MTLEQFARDVPGQLQAVQLERIVITQEGKPIAVLVGIEHKDAEDWRLELSPEFWRMIEERRKETESIPLEEIERELREEELRCAEKN